MSKVGDLVAAFGRYDGGAWLYRVTRITPKRVYVEQVERPSDRFTSNPASGGGAEKYFYVRPMAVRDMEHFAVISKARADYLQTKQNAEATCADRIRKAKERLDEAIK